MTNDAGAVHRHLDVSRETMERLEIFAALLRKWSERINLVSKSTLPDLWTRHILDSAQILELSPAKKRGWADLGSGGGFPGAVVAIIAAEENPDLAMNLVESDQRKAAFLRTVARETGVSMGVIAKRIDDVAALGADVVSARALAPLPDLLRYSQRHLAPDGVALFLKGSSAEEEIANALETWRFDCETWPSQTDKDAVILRIGEIERV